MVLIPDADDLLTHQISAFAQATEQRLDKTFLGIIYIRSDSDARPEIWHIRQKQMQKQKKNRRLGKILGMVTTWMSKPPVEGLAEHFDTCKL